MKLIVDDADVKKIRRIAEFYPIDGVTTNPSILAKNRRAPYEVLTEIQEIMGKEKEIHVQVISQDAEGMVKEAYAIVKRLGEGTYIKIPSTEEGLKAIRILSEKGIHTTATAIYTPMQAFLAGKSGADYAAPYINRIDNLGANGVETAKTIHDIFRNNGLKTNVLAASFKNSQQIQELCKYGIGAVTAGCEIIEGLVQNASVNLAIKNFNEDFEKLCGKGKNMSNCY